MRSFSLWFLVVGIFMSFDAEARRVPKYQSHVLDQSGLLTPLDLKNSRESLRNLEKQYGVKLAVLVVPSLHDDVLKKFAKRVARRWKFTENMDGALLVVSLREREWFIESFGKIRKAVNTRTLTAIDALVFEPLKPDALGISVSNWRRVFDGLCAEALIPEIRLGRPKATVDAPTHWRRWLDIPLLVLGLWWLVVHIKRIRMAEFHHIGGHKGWTSVDRESTFGGGTSRHGSFGGGGGSAAWGRSH